MTKSPNFVFNYLKGKITERNRDNKPTGLFPKRPPWPGQSQGLLGLPSHAGLFQEHLQGAGWKMAQPELKPVPRSGYQHCRQQLNHHDTKPAPKEQVIIYRLNCFLIHLCVDKDTICPNTHYTSRIIKDEHSLISTMITGI